MKTTHIGLIQGVLLGAMVASATAMAAGNGPAALEKARDAVGRALQGQTASGQPCDLSLETATGGLLLGEPVLGTYKLTVGGKESEFDFIDETESTGNSDDLKFETIQHLDSDNSPDEGGFHPGSTTKMTMEISTRGRSIVVKIDNGPVVSCRFDR